MARPLKLPQVYDVIALDSVDSTNAEAKRLAAQGAEEGTLVWAHEQTAGYGRRGQEWASPPGNLYFSLILRPECPVEEGLQLTFVAAVALGEALGAMVPPLVERRYKWPNDILLNRRKVAGILAESSLTGDRLDWIVLGVGVNVETYPEDTEFPATSIRYENEARQSPHSPEDILEAFARHFVTWVNRWLDHGFAPIRDAWLRHAMGLGERIEVHLDKETLSGRFVGLDETGALILEFVPAGGRRIITGGEIYPVAR